MKKDVFWFNQDKWNDSISTIIITEKCRMSEYERSEYFSVVCQKALLLFLEIDQIFFDE